MKIIKLLPVFILGVFLTIFVYQAFTIYQLRAIAAENRQIILQDRAVMVNVVNFLQAKYPELQKQEQTTKPAANTNTSTQTKTETTSTSSSQVKR